MSKPYLFLRIRSYADEATVSVWLIQREGKDPAVESWLLHNGKMLPSAADALAEKLGLPVERESRGAEPAPEKTDLFQ